MRKFKKIQKEKPAAPEDLKDALDKSSAANRNLLFFFLPAMVYILIVAASTTDLQLLVPKSTIKLPVLGSEINLFYFYATAPVLVVVFHFTLLFNLILRAKKLHAWVDKNPGLGPFLYNYTVVFMERTISNFLLQATLWTAYFFLFFFILVFIQWRFGVNGPNVQTPGSQAPPVNYRAFSAMLTPAGAKQEMLGVIRSRSF